MICNDINDTKTSRTKLLRLVIFGVLFSVVLLPFVLTAVVAGLWDSDDWPCGVGALPPCNFSPDNHTVVVEPDEISTIGVSDLEFSVDGQSLGTDEIEFDGKREVEILDASVPIVSFNHNFTNSSLNLSNLRIRRQTDRYGYTIISNLNISTTKSLYIPKVSRINRICVKDADIESIDEITKDCTGPSETLFEPCPSGGLTINGLTCTLFDTYYRVDNLTHSGGYEQPPETKTGYYTVQYLTAGPNYREGYLHEDDMIQICFAAADDILEDEFLRISLVPSDGYPTYLEFSTPYVLSTERVYLYP